MWFQVELPQPAMITEVQFDAGAPGGGGRGRGGRGAPPAARTGAARRAGAPPRARPHLARAPRQRRHSAAPRQAAAAAARRSFGSFPIGYKVQLSMDGKTWSAPVARGRGLAGDDRRDVPPTQAKFVRVTQTGTARERAGVVGAELPRLRGGERGGALNASRVYGEDGGNGFNTKERRRTETNEGPVAPRDARAASDEGRKSKHPLSSRCFDLPAARPMPLAGRSAGDATGLLVDAPRQPPCVSVTLRFFVLNPLSPSPPAPESERHMP